MEKYSEKRPWGGFERFTLNEISTVKLLTINPGQKFSLQYHEKREEFWRFLDNPAKVTIGDKVKEMVGGDEVVIKPGMNHRIEALSEPVNVLEISFGEFDENEIVRIEDAYGRE